MLEAVKTALRITDNEFDAEVQGLIDASIGDLRLAGIDPAKIVESDAFARQTVITYCKAHFGYDNEEAPRFSESYDGMKRSMALSSLYRADGGVVA